MPRVDLDRRPTRRAAARARLRPSRSSSSSAVVRMPRRPVCRRAIPSSSRSSSSGSIRMFESEPMQSGIERSSTAATRRKPSPRSASVVGQAQIRAPVRREEVELVVVRVRGVDDRRPRAEAAGVGEQLDRPAAVLLEALLDLARLLVGVDVQRQPLARGIGTDLLEPRPEQARTEWGATPTAIPAARSDSTSLEIRRDGAAGACGRGRRARRRRGAARSRSRPLPPPRPPRTPRQRRGSGTRRPPCSRRRASRDRRRRSAPGRVRGRLVGLLEHPVAPRPEVGTGGAAAQRTLERVAVAVDEAGQRESLTSGHNRRRVTTTPARLATTMEPRPFPRPCGRSRTR